MKTQALRWGSLVAALIVVVGCGDAGEDALSVAAQGQSGDACAATDECADGRECFVGVCVELCSVGAECGAGQCNPIPGRDFGWCDFGGAGEQPGSAGDAAGADDPSPADDGSPPLSPVDEVDDGGDDHPGGGDMPDNDEHEGDDPIAEEDSDEENDPSDAVDPVVGDSPDVEGDDPEHDANPEIAGEDGSNPLDDPDASRDGEDGGDGPQVPDVEPCAYPAQTGSIQLGQVMPNLAWRDAYDAQNNSIQLDMETLHCAPEYDRYHVIAFYVGTAWCSSCPAYLSALSQQAQQIDAAGGLIIWVEAEDESYQPASSRFAAEHINRTAAQAPGIRVGDADTIPSRAIYNAPLVQSFPAAFVVRRSDMQIIADQNQSQFMLDFAGIAREVAGGGGGGGGGGGVAPGGGVCGPDAEETYEPNNNPANAPVIPAGSFDGGICDAQADFYRIDARGPWRLDLSFQHAQGDLDMYVWDLQRGQPESNGAGGYVGSDSTNDSESFEYTGPATVVVVGYEGAQAPYRLTLTEQ